MVAKLCSYAVFLSEYLARGGGGNDNENEGGGQTFSAPMFILYIHI